MDKAYNNRAHRSKRCRDSQVFNQLFGPINVFLTWGTFSRKYSYYTKKRKNMRQNEICNKGSYTVTVSGNYIRKGKKGKRQVYEGEETQKQMLGKMDGDYEAAMGPLKKGYQSCWVPSPLLLG